MKPQWLRSSNLDNLQFYTAIEIVCTVNIINGIAL